MSAHRFHGLELPVRILGGARASRVAHRGGQTIGAHRHDWPLLTIPLLGGYREEMDDAAVAVEGPAAIFHPAGRCHSNCIHRRGMETFSIEFDPAWLRWPPPDRSVIRVGGAVALQSRKLARLWHDPTASERTLRSATAGLLAAVRVRPDPPRPRWLARAAELAEWPTSAIARELGLNPAWLARAYRTAAGEGLQETARRNRAERAVDLLRSTDAPIAEIAAAAGFCDQSHLNRALGALLGRTPAQVRREGALLPAA